MPYLGGRQAHGVAPSDWTSVTSGGTGYVQHVDMGTLDGCATELGSDVWLVALPGTFVHEASPLVHVGAGLAEDAVQELRSAFTLSAERSFDQDPRFGLIVLSEIASRALSPAVNDPGTAISVIGRLVRLLSLWNETHEQETNYPGVMVPAIDPAEMIEDAFRPIARDGAALVEVQIRLQKALQALQAVAPKAFGTSGAAMAREARDRASGALEAHEYRQLQQIANE